MSDLSLIIQVKDPVDLIIQADDQMLALQVRPLEIQLGLPSPGGVTLGEHLVIDQLVHEIAENSFEEISYTGNRVDSIIIYTDAAKTTKIRETLFTYTGNQVNTVTTIQYDAVGEVVPGQTMIETYVYAANKVVSITAVLA